MGNFYGLKPLYFCSQKYWQKEFKMIRSNILEFHKADGRANSP